VIDKERVAVDVVEVVVRQAVDGPVADHAGDADLVLPIEARRGVVIRLGAGVRDTGRAVRDADGARRFTCAVVGLVGAGCRPCVRLIVVVEAELMVGAGVDRSLAG
jgi:hypothetical protein